MEAAGARFLARCRPRPKRGARAAGTGGGFPSVRWPILVFAEDWHFRCRKEFHDREKEMVRRGDEAQRCHGPEEKCLQAIGPEKDRAFGEELGGAEQKAEGESEALGDVDALVLCEPRGKEPFRGAEEEAGEGEGRAEKAAGLSGRFSWRASFLCGDPGRPRHCFWERPAGFVLCLFP